MDGRFPECLVTPSQSRSGARRATRAGVALAALCVALVGCRSEKGSSPRARPAPEDRKGIVGGTDVAAGDIVTKSTVALLRGTKDILCTGTLVAPNAVLSAAHCFDGGIDRSNLYVGFGLDVDSLKTFKVTRVLSNPRYDSNAPLQEKDPIHDTAVLSFEGVAPAGTAPAVLASPTLPLGPGSKHILSGFGLSWTSTFIIWRTSGGAGTLRRVDLSLSSVLASSKQLKFTSNDGKAVCSGDSGGPAYLQQGNTLVVTGITSWGYSDCEQGLSVFSDVRAYRDWIDGALAQLGASTGGGVGSGPGGGSEGGTGGGSGSGDGAVPSPTPNNGSGSGAGEGEGSDPNGGGLGEILDPLWSAVAGIDIDALRDAWTIVTARRAGTFTETPGEIASKNEGKYTTKVLLFVANTPAKYRCVQIRPGLSTYGKAWGAREGQYVYYGPVRLSQESNFDAFGCRWQNNGDYWYLY